MRLVTSWIVSMWLVVACVPAAGDDLLLDASPSILPAASTYRFSDEEPPWLQARRPASELNTAAAQTLAVPSDEQGNESTATGAARRLLAVIAPSDTSFSDFLSPVTNPVYFENPRTVTEARVLFLHQKFPMTALGGDVDILTLQLRAALTDRLSIIATKDGFATTSSPVIEDGWADVNVGLKYNLLSDPALHRLLSIGMSYELPIGSTRTYQGNGAGLFELFASGGARLRDWHCVSAAGLLLPADRSAESTFWFWSSHLSHPIGNTNWHVLGELNWFHWLASGASDFPRSIEGGDLFNFGSAGVSGNDIVTGALGFRYKPSDHLEFGIAWEAPLTQRRDLLDNRMTFDWIVRY